METACIHCAGRFPIADGGSAGAEHDLATALADPRAAPGADATAAPARAGELDQEFVCPSCHGVVGFVGTLSADRCPFCGHAVESSDVRTAPDRLPIDGIVPLGLDQATAEQHVREWISKRRWAPRAFKKYHSTGSFAGIYLPFFTFDAQTATGYTGQRGEQRTRTVRDKDGSTREETYTDWEDVSGRVEKFLDDVEISAESSVDGDRMRDLEPWPSGAAVAFRPEYLAGFLARRYDRSLAQCRADARIRMGELVDDAIRADIGGSDQKITSKDTTWSNETFRHLLLPVFLLVVNFKAKPYQVAVNGVTGEVHGKRPWSWVKIGAAVMAVVLAAVLWGLVIWLDSSESEAATRPRSESVSDMRERWAALDAEREARTAAAAERRAADEAAEAARVYTPADCTEAVSGYRLLTPNTYFPSVRACDALTAEQRLQAAQDAFEQDEIRNARRAALALDAPESTGSRPEICRAELTLAAAKTAADQDPGGEVYIDGACRGLDQATIDRLSDEAAEEYSERRKQALADAR